MRAPESNSDLIDLVKYRAESYIGGGPRDARVLEAMRKIDRARFLPTDSRVAAYFDEAVDIGLGQTCSQPSMVAFMLDKLVLRPGLRVLEVGAGCGYVAALLAILCSPRGAVLAAEILPELASCARANCSVAFSAYGSAAEVLEIVHADASEGIPDRGPYDRILVSAGVSRPRFREGPLLAQLDRGGILVYPEARGSLYRVSLGEQGIVRDRWGGVAFVRLRGKNG